MLQKQSTKSLKNYHIEQLDRGIDDSDDEDTTICSESDIHIDRDSSDTDNHLDELFNKGSDDDKY